MSTAIAPFVPSTSLPARARVRDAFKNEDGAFDLPSILVGVVVVGILTAGVLASIFGVIPFAQDKGAQQDLGAVVTAEGAFKATANPIAYGDLVQLQTGNTSTGSLLGSGVHVGVAKTADSAHFAAVAKSGSGKVFVVSDSNTTPIDYVAGADATADAAFANAS